MSTLGPLQAWQTTTFPLQACHSSLPHHGVGPGAARAAQLQAVEASLPVTCQHLGQVWLLHLQHQAWLLSEQYRQRWESNRGVKVTRVLPGTQRWSQVAMAKGTKAGVRDGVRPGKAGPRIWPQGLQEVSEVPPGSLVRKDSKGLRGKGVGDTLLFNRTWGPQDGAGSPGWNLDLRLLTIDPSGRDGHLYPTIPSKGHL